MNKQANRLIELALSTKCIAKDVILVNADNNEADQTAWTYRLIDSSVYYIGLTRPCYSDPNDPTFI